MLTLTPVRTSACYSISSSSIAAPGHSSVTTFCIGSSPRVCSVDDAGLSGGAQDYRFKKGSQVISDLLLANVTAGGVRVTYNTTVKAVSNTGHSAQVVAMLL